MKLIAGSVAPFLLLLPMTAHAESSVDVLLSAHVDAFCHIYPPASSAITVINGSAVIGQVREICNTPSGYDVATGFTNLSAGKLSVGANSYQIDNGFALRSSTVPAAMTSTWTLNDAQLVEQDQQVLVQITITPR